MGPGGEIEPLDEGGLDGAFEALKGAEVEAVAVCLLFVFAHPEHERRVGEALRAALPHVHALLSSEVLPEFREYERNLLNGEELPPKAGRELEKDGVVTVETSGCGGYGRVGEER